MASLSDPAATAANLDHDDVQKLDRLRDSFRRLQAELGKVIIGQRETIDRLAICLFARGHALLMGVPGLAKTLLVSRLAEAVSLKFSRIQFTPDLMPMDITGTDILQESGDGRRGFHFVPGPVFANIVLADEINRAPPKTQAAMLEAMQEQKVTVVGKTSRLEPPFFVLATQNPVEQEGTYALPEAQVDRFLLKLVVGYPTKEDEKKIIDRMALTSSKIDVPTVTSLDAIANCRRLLDTIYVDEKVKSYIVDLVFATRKPEEHGLAALKPLILYGASPRASIALTRAARARAFLSGRGYVQPQDVKAIGYSVLRHRVLTTYEAEAEGIGSEDVLRKVFDTVPVP